MQPATITTGIRPEELTRMVSCFQPNFKDFSPGETILRYSDHLQQVGVLLCGSAHLYCMDADGEYSLLDTFEKNDVFGELFCLPLLHFEYIAEAKTPCRAMFIDYNHIIRPCNRVCEHHTKLIHNLFTMAATKAQSLSLHLTILSQHSLRKKLLTYLRYAQTEAGSNPFYLPISLVSLSEYLCVDRSAMMRELRFMKQEGLLCSKGREFTLL